MKFPKPWIQDRENDFNVSFGKLNKKHSISKEHYLESETHYLYNIWQVKRYFLVDFHLESNIEHRDQMTVH